MGGAGESAVVESFGLWGFGLKYDKYYPYSGWAQIGARVKEKSTRKGSGGENFLLSHQFTGGQRYLPLIPWPLVHFCRHYFWPKIDITYTQVLPEEKTFPVIPRSEWLGQLSAKYARRCLKIWDTNLEQNFPSLHSTISRLEVALSWILWLEAILVKEAILSKRKSRKKKKEEENRKPQSFDWRACPRKNIS